MCFQSLIGLSAEPFKAQHKVTKLCDFVSCLKIHGLTKEGISLQPQEFAT